MALRRVPGLAIGVARLGLLCGLSICATLTPALAQSPQRGVIKTIDPQRGAVTITANGQDLEFATTPNTRFADVAGQPLADGLRSAEFKAGTTVMFGPRQLEGKPTLWGMKLVSAPKLTPPLTPAQLEALKPLCDMGADERYQDFAGGLYPDGKNVRPAPHEAAGLALAGQIRPLDRDGHADPAGTIVLLAIGMSNTNQAFGGLQRAAAEDRSLNPRVTLVNGAIGGMTARRIQRLEDGGATGSRRGYWGQVDERLADAKVTRAQVQAVWLKQADGQPTEGFPSYAKTLEAELGNIVRLLHERFPNLKQVYLSSRAYGGWAKTPLNPEPYAYESGFSVKWLVEAQLRGDPELNFDATRGAVKAPWLSWGPYLWARGATPSADGFAFEESDFAADGTHESPAGQAKIGRRLLDFFKTDSTTRTWFCAE